MRNIFRQTVIYFLTLEARVFIWRTKPKIAVVTGSVGKTSTKEALALALSSFVSVSRSKKSFNSDIGVPLAILELPNAWSNPILWFLVLCQGLVKALFKKKVEWLVLEVGADKPGDMRPIFRWLRPHMVLVTHIPHIPVHVEFYKNPQQVFEEETSPIYALEDGGTLILNCDDERVRNLGKESREKVITYGLTPLADVYAHGDRVIYEEMGKRKIPKGIQFDISYQGRGVSVELLGTLGIQNMYAVAGGFAGGISAGGNIESMAKRFIKYKTSPGRMRIVEGLKKTTIIDDTYNSSPAAALEALRTLKNLEIEGRKIAVLGDMKELGEHSEGEHRKVGGEVASIADILLTVGLQARMIAEGALNGGMDESKIYQFDDVKEVGKFLEFTIKEGDTVLIKGSQSVRMEKIVFEIMAHPKLAKSLLVRQDEGWENR